MAELRFHSFSNSAKGYRSCKIFFLTTYLEQAIEVVSVGRFEKRARESG